MKKTLVLLLIAALCVGLLAGCGTDTPSATPTDDGAAVSGEPAANTTIDTLRVAFVPSREPEEIITATEPLKQLLTDELAKLGYDVKEVDITVGTSYEAVGEALSAGTADVGLIPGGTYVLYDDGCDVILTPPATACPSTPTAPKTGMTTLPQSPPPSKLPATVRL